jgi:hypothetical protein
MGIVIVFYFGSKAVTDYLSGRQPTSESPEGSSQGGSESANRRRPNRKNHPVLPLGFGVEKR